VKEVEEERECANRVKLAQLAHKSCFCDLDYIFGHIFASKVKRTFMCGCWMHLKYQRKNQLAKPRALAKAAAKEGRRLSSTKSDTLNGKMSRLMTIFGKG
jgi:hypothetical protein